MSKHNRPLEERAIACEVRADDQQEGTITGRPIVFNSWTDLGWFDEIIDSRALDTTDLTDVRFLVNHDLSKIPLARSRRNNGSSTMQLITDAEGLLIKAQLDTENNAEAKSLYSAIQRGDISGMSFMFSVRGDEWQDLDTEHPKRRITDIESVVEVSAVTFPAYDATSINARSKEALESARSALESARQQTGEPLESEEETRRNDETDLELAKAKFEFYQKLNGGHKS